MRKYRANVTQKKEIWKINTYKLEITWWTYLWKLAISMQYYSSYKTNGFLNDPIFQSTLLLQFGPILIILTALYEKNLYISLKKITHGQFHSFIHLRCIFKSCFYSFFRYISKTRKLKKVHLFFCVLMYKNLRLSH